MEKASKEQIMNSKFHRKINHLKLKCRVSSEIIKKRNLQLKLVGDFGRVFKEMFTKEYTQVVKEYNRRKKQDGFKRINKQN